MTKLTFPYTMHCMHCKVGIKVKNKAMIGKMVNCPKCKKRIEIITPDEDGYIPYTMGEAPEPEPEPEPTDEELEELELKQQRARRDKTMATTKHVATIFWYLLLLGAVAGIFIKFVLLDKEKPKENVDAGRPVPSFYSTANLANLPPVEDKVRPDVLV